MLQFLKKWIPVLIVFATIINLIASYSAGNDLALNANIIALTGWLVIAVETFTKRSQYES
jgi:hypothetical protein